MTIPPSHRRQAGGGALQTKSGGRVGIA